MIASLLQQFVKFMLIGLKHFGGLGLGRFDPHLDIIVIQAHGKTHFAQICRMQLDVEHPQHIATAMQLQSTREL